MNGFSFPPHRLPGLEPLLVGDLWSRWVADGRAFALDDLRSAVGYLRLKPNDSCRMTVLRPEPSTGAETESASETPLGFYLQLYSTPERAREVFEKEKTRRHTLFEDGFTPFLCEESATVALPFPNDPDLPTLRHIYEPDRFRRDLAEILPAYPADQWRVKRRRLGHRVLAYKPGRRCVLGTKLELRRRDGTEKLALRLHLQVENPQRARESFSKAQRIGAALASTSARTPHPYGIVRGRGWTATEWIEGVDLAHLPVPQRNDPSLWREIGRTVARLHRSHIELPHRPSPIERAADTSQLAADLTAMMPDAAAELADLERLLVLLGSSWATESSAIAHGDLHLGQVMVHEGEPVLCDFDRAGRGYAVEDLGNFLASTLGHDVPQVCRSAFVDGYAELRPLPRSSLIHGATAIALFHLAPAPFRRLDPEWPERTRRILDLCRRSAEEALR
ncbi:MAG: phosphotransferase [Planctomycetes bacterium]|nr:phosphotransferase [Planctomycetota bacterium]